MSSIKNAAVSALCQLLDGVEALPGGGYTVDLRYANSPANVDKMKQLEDDLRRLFVLPVKSKMRYTVKYVSGIMLHIARRMGYDISRVVKCYRPDPKVNFYSRLGFYTCTTPEQTNTTDTTDTAGAASGRL